MKNENLTEKQKQKLEDKAYKKILKQINNEFSHKKTARQLKAFSEVIKQANE